MPGLHIPLLNKKLDLLRKHAGLTWKILGEQLGKSPKTIAGWGYGAGGNPPDTVADANISNVLNLFAEALSQHDAVDAKALTLGPIDRFEAALKVQDYSSFRALIDQEGITDKGALFMRTGHGLSVIETEKMLQERYDHQIAPGSWFRIEFATGFHGRHVLAMQWTQQAWHFVPCHFDREGGNIYLPDLDEDGKPTFMRETQETGRSQFIALHLDVPLPATVLSAFQNKTRLDRTDLSELAAYFLRQSTTRRRLFVINVDIRKQDR